VINLFDPELPTKRDLIAHLRKANPDLTVVWLVPAVLVPLSWFAFALQKMIRPGKPALSIAKLFGRLAYDTSSIARLAPAIQSDISVRKEAEWQALPPPVDHGKATANLRQSALVR
jgi:hypothetical protein